MPSTKQNEQLPRLKILGVGSAGTRTLKANVKEALRQLSLNIMIDEVERLEQLMEYDISGIPALAFEGKILFQKVVPSVEDLKELFKYLLAIPANGKGKETGNSYLSFPKVTSMKSILFPTDFSKTAANALPFAVDLANRFGSRLTILHAYQVHTTASTLIKMEAYLQTDAEQDMDKLVRELAPQLNNGATVESKIVQSDAVDAITQTAKAQQADLIVMGTQGAASMLETLVGTHTNSVLKNTALPVLVIPDGVVHRPFQTIVLAVDEIEEFNPATLKPLVAIAQSYASMVRIYHKDEANDGLNTAIDAYLGGIDRSYHYELDADNLIESLNDFVEEYNAELLCMIRRQRSFLENVFHDSATSQEVFDAKVPLLLLHDA